MHTRSARRLVSVGSLAIAFLCASNLRAQSETATVRAAVTDPTGAFVSNASVRLFDVDHGTKVEGSTNESGVCSFANVAPGHYRMEVSKTGFKVINLTGITVNVQDNLEENFRLDLGSEAISVTVEASAQRINMSDGAVSTVVDRQFVENIPLNGRSFQSLILLTPGVAAVANTLGTNAAGSFSINGQRPGANNFSVDGVNANFAASPGSFNNLQTSGNLPGLTVLGTTQSLASVDALQEFKVQTSTYAAEYGPQPGGQISILTRSGTNQYHGSLFEYLRNDHFDANDWFTDRLGAAKPPERQNDFGGTLGGPVVIPRLYNGRNRTFFFFSYEGLRLRLPQFTLTNVPTVAIRQQAAPGVQPLLNAFPLPNGRDLGNGFAEFSAGYSNPSSLNTTAIRIDHTVNNKLTLFARYNRSPSTSTNRSPQDLAVVNPAYLGTQTITAGATAMLSPRMNNEVRVNYSGNTATQLSQADNFEGAVPPPRSALVPSQYDNPPFTQGVIFFTAAAGTPGFTAPSTPNLNPIGDVDSSQYQLNLRDNFSFTTGSHQLKFGVDYRRLTPVVEPNTYVAFGFFTGTAQLISGVAGTEMIQAGVKILPIFNQYSVFAQDNWKIFRRLTINYGVRWDVIPSPSEANGNLQASLSQITDLTTMTLAPAGTKQWQTTYNNFAPRVGLAYQLSQTPGRETVVRGGFGIFYDTGNDRATQNSARFPYTATKTLTNVSYPLTASVVAPPTVPASVTPPFTVPTALTFFDPHLKLPYTWQWNVAVEQALGKSQVLTVSYIGAAGRRLLQATTQVITTINVPKEFTSLGITRNTATSDYDALQAQFQRSLARGLQALASYTWSHTLDDDSDSTTGRVPQRGNASFDIRHLFSAALTYDIPSPGSSMLARTVFGHWSVDSSFRAQSGAPFDIISAVIVDPIDGAQITSRPNLVSGVPLYVDDPTVPGGRRVNRAAFTVPATGVAGNFGRNQVRGLGAWQQDFSIRRQFSLHESLKLQFRAEAFNVFNHPNFGGISSTLTSATFGQATNMLNRQLGGISQLYQIGGPRSLQFAIKLIF